MRASVTQRWAYSRGGEAKVIQFDFDGHAIEINDETTRPGGRVLVVDGRNILIPSTTPVGALHRRMPAASRDFGSDEYGRTREVEIDLTEAEAKHLRELLAESAG